MRYNHSINLIAALFVKLALFLVLNINLTLNFNTICIFLKVFFNCKKNISSLLYMMIYFKVVIGAEDRT